MAESRMISYLKNDDDDEDDDGDDDDILDTNVDNDPGNNNANDDEIESTNKNTVVDDYERGTMIKGGDIAKNNVQMKNYTNIDDIR